MKSKYRTYIVVSCCVLALLIILFVLLIIYHKPSIKGKATSSSADIIESSDGLEFDTKTATKKDRLLDENSEESGLTEIDLLAGYEAYSGDEVETTVSNDNFVDNNINIEQATIALDDLGLETSESKELTDEEKMKAFVDEVNEENANGIRDNTDENIDREDLTYPNPSEYETNYIDSSSNNFYNVEDDEVYKFMRERDRVQASMGYTDGEAYGY